MDANVDTEIFRKNHPVILACNRHQALIRPVRMWYGSTKLGVYLAGQVLALNSSNELHQEYDADGSSGIDTAVGVLLHDLDVPSGETRIAEACFGGTLFYDKCIDIDSNAVVDLKGRKIVDATGEDLLKF